MKTRNIIKLVFNLLALLGEVVAILVCCKVILVANATDTMIQSPVDLVKYFSMLASLIVAVGLLISAIDNIVCLAKKKASSPCIFGIKMISVTTGLMLFLMTLLYLLPKTGSVATVGDTFTTLILAFIVPLLFAAVTIFLDLDNKWKFKTTFLAPLTTAIYFAYALPLFISKVWADDPYQLTQYFTAQNWWKGLLIILAFLAAAYVIGFVIWLLNRIVYLIFIGEEVDQEISKEEEEVAAVVKVTKEDEVLEKQEEEEVKKSGYIGPRIYHVSRHKQDGRWQVKFVNGQRALKITDTQAEAIVFAKKLIKEHGGSLRVHSVKGRIRKA